MRLLLDTHIFLWFINGDRQLNTRSRTIIEDDTNEKLISIANVWEIAIKVSTGKLKITPNFEQGVFLQIELNAFEILPIATAHLAEVARLPFHHRDPFDRLLIAQSKAENIPLISADGAFDAYGIQRLWS